MRVFADGFRHYGGTGAGPNALMPKKWTIAQGQSITSTGGPLGAYGCTLGTLGRTVPPNNSYATSWQFKIDVTGTFGTGQICQFMAVTTSHVLAAICNVQLENDGTISIYAGNNLAGRTSGADAIHTGTFYSLEVNVKTAFNVSTGQVNINAYLRINQVVKIATGVVNANMFVTGLLSGDAKITAVQFQGSNLGASTIGPPLIYDDQVDVGATYNLTSHQGVSGPTAWAGDFTGGLLLPAADVLTQWAHTGGDTFSQLASNPPDLTKFASSATANQKDAMTYQAAANLPILTLQYVLYASKSDSGTREISFRSGAGATEAIGPVVSLSDDPVFLIGGRDSNPASGLQWTKATVDAKAFGFNLDL